MLTKNKIEVLELINEAENPEEAVKIFADIVHKMLDKNSITNKITELVLQRYSSLAEFAKAIGFTEKKTVNVMLEKEEPTLDDVIIMAKALDKAPEEIAEIFIAKAA